MAGDWTSTCQHPRTPYFWNIGVFKFGVASSDVLAIIYQTPVSIYSLWSDGKQKIIIELLNNAAADDDDDYKNGVLCLFLHKSEMNFPNLKKVSE